MLHGNGRRGVCGDGNRRQVGHGFDYKRAFFGGGNRAYSCHIGTPHIAYRHGTVQAAAENRFSLSDVCDYKRNIRCIVRRYDR